SAQPAGPLLRRDGPSKRVRPQAACFAQYAERAPEPTTRGTCHSAAASAQEDSKTLDSEYHCLPESSLSPERVARGDCATPAATASGRSPARRNAAAAPAPAFG